MKRNHLKLIILIIFLAKALVFGQSKYPADTLLVSKNTSIIKKIGILPISGFQRISYNFKSMNCQFHPSCSNYGAKAIKEFGVIRGSFIASDRIVRCNPTALEYHLKHGGDINKETLQLNDPLILSKPLELKKSPAMSVALSAIIPGAGRMYSGRWIDGLMGLTRFIFYSSITAYANKKDIDILVGFTGVITIIAYGGEIYGAYRTAKYYQ
jgi:putative component of membrane protein insertase Oxa1/YidC/SpoIIIJ protein YidD